MTRPNLMLALDIAAVLKRPLHELRGFAHADGRAMSPRAVRAALEAQLANGRELLHVGPAHVFTVKSST